MPEISDERLKELETAAEKAKALESSNARLLEESKKNKEKSTELSERLNKLEEEKLQSEGKTQELLDKEKLRSAELEEMLKGRTKAVLDEKVRSEVAKVAKDAHDIDMLLRVKEHKALLKIDEEALTVSGIEDFVNKTRESHAYLFGKKKMPVDGGGKPPVDGGGAPDERTEEQKFVDELSKVNSRKEQIEVYKKYGKPVDSFMSQR